MCRLMQNSIHLTESFDSTVDLIEDTIKEMPVGFIGVSPYSSTGNSAADAKVYHNRNII